MGQDPDGDSKIKYPLTSFMTKFKICTTKTEPHLAELRRGSFGLFQHFSHFLLGRTMVHRCMEYHLSTISLRGVRGVREGFVFDFRFCTFKKQVRSHAQRIEKKHSNTPNCRS